MRGFQFTSSIMLITISLFSLQTKVEAAFTMNETCAQLTTGWIANPESCQGWGYCSNGILKGTGKCSDGLLFDTQTGTCNEAEDVTCATTVDDICQTSSMPQMIADPNDCTQFCYCDGTGNYTCASCPQYQSYNPTLNQCVWSSTYNCPADSICRLVPNNKFAGDPENCGNYLHCLNGAGTSKSCANGQFFNAQTGYCVNVNPCSEDDNDDEPPTIIAGPGVLTDLPADPSKCIAYVPGGTAAQFFTDGQSCMGYFTCTNAVGPGTWSKCPLGTHFNSATQQCVTPNTVLCNFDRCGNINQQFVTAASTMDTSCKNYLYCNNQTTRSTAACPADFNFFNEVTGYCTPSLPATKICGTA